VGAAANCVQLGKQPVCSLVSNKRRGLNVASYERVVLCVVQVQNPFLPSTYLERMLGTCSMAIATNDRMKMQSCSLTAAHASGQLIVENGTSSLVSYVCQTDTLHNTAAYCCCSLLFTAAGLVRDFGPQLTADIVHAMGPQLTAALVNEFGGSFTSQLVRAFDYPLTAGEQGLQHVTCKWC
jgi:hypothetical protein